MDAHKRRVFRLTGDMDARKRSVGSLEECRLPGDMDAHKRSVYRLTGDVMARGR